MNLLDPQAAALLRQFAEKGLPPVQSLTPEQARAAFHRRRALTQAAPPPLDGIREHELAGPAVRLRLRHYPDRSRSGGALLYLHGGGWTVGDLDTHDVLCRSLALRTPCSVFALEYRLAPEAPFPAAYEDTLAAFRWIAAQATELGIDARRIAIGGDSAGGNLGAAACLALRGDVVAPCFQLLVYPATDQRAAAPSHTSNGQGYLLTREAVLWYRDNYLPHPADHLDWRASPLLAPSHEGLAPALVLTAGFDPLRDEGRGYADALSLAGVATQYVCFERQIHGFALMGGVLRETETAVDLCAAALRRALGPGSARFE